LETRNEKGELVESIDFEKLRAELGTFSDMFESRRERYGMDWPGKKDCLKIIQQPSIGTLKPCRKESVNFDSTENLFVEGDNLEVLKLLQKSYYGRVKMIYIDPPYNTGREFIYPDNYTESLNTYLAYAGLVDDEGKRFSTNTPNEGRFHTKWLNMMYPRLYLARNLLREDGAIFISIDDNEVYNLRLLMNDIFGEENFIATVIWQKVYSPKNSARLFSEDHDYILVYARNAVSWTPNLLPRTAEADARYENLDNDPRGDWKPGDLTARNYYSEGQYEAISPSGRRFKASIGRYWVVKSEKFLELDKDRRIWWGPHGDNMPAIKRFLSEVKQGIVAQTLWKYEEVGHTQEAKKELLEFVGFEYTDNVLDTVKPTRLLQRIIQLSTTVSENDIVLDFFAGSSSLAHAAIKQNNEDSGNRKFICVQLPELLPIAETKLKTIADIGKERVRRAIKKIDEEQKTKIKGAGNQLPGFEDEQPQLDLGFKVFKLDRSNFKIWDGSNAEASEKELIQQLQLHIDHIDPAATPEDILYELLLKSGFVPTQKVEKLTMAGKTIFSIAEGALLICLEGEITRELVEAVAEAAPRQFICLDEGFGGNDQLKANAVQTFAARNQSREKADQIVFRTV
jgi:adenine-specific DNA-methyltransferase